MKDCVLFLQNLTRDNNNNGKWITFYANVNFLFDVINNSKVHRVYSLWAFDVKSFLHVPRCGTEIGYTNKEKCQPTTYVDTKMGKVREELAKIVIVTSQKNNVLD